jgi:hypothetical protein
MGRIMSEPNEQELPVLNNLESCILRVWKTNVAMTDYTVLRAFDLAFQFYREEARGHVPKPPSPSGLDAIAYEAVRDICELSLGRGTAGEGFVPVPVTVLVDCLRRLKKSVERHTALQGRTGYLNFIAEYVG